MSLFIHHLLQVQTQSSLLLRSDKVYVILAVLLVIFGVLLGVMFRTQRKLGKIENQLEGLKNHRDKDIRI